MSSIKRFTASRLFRPFLLTLGLALFATTAQAYTVVMKGGKVIDIPNTFVVTATTLTYEVRPGIQVTLQLSAIDVRSTEKANGEAPGSLLSRVQQKKAISKTATQQPKVPARRTVTNRDLDSFARTRRESELAYDRRQRELGLPSLEESRRQAEEQQASMQARFEQSQAEDREQEAYWRERAINLKADIAATDAEINSIRQQLDWMPRSNSFISVGTGLGGFTGLGQLSVNPTLLNPAVPQVFVTPQIGPQMGFGGRVITRGQVFGSPFHRRGRFPRFGNSFGFFPGFVGGYAPDDFSSERIALEMRLNELVARRAGLQARWRALEEEARRAGALPGWLRP